MTARSYSEIASLASASVPDPQQTAGTGPADPAIRLLVVDDHDLYRHGIVVLLATEPDIEVVAQASTGLRGVRLARELHPDVVLMDLRLPDIDGIEAIARVIADNPRARIVALTVAASDADVDAAIAAGACGFLAKDVHASAVAAAVRAAAQGAAWFSAVAAEIVFARLRDAPSAPSADVPGLAELSVRELEVLRLIGRGFENTEIAAALTISPRTVKNHVSSVLTKLGLTSRVHAAIYAVRHGLV